MMIKIGLTICGLLGAGCFWMSGYSVGVKSDQEIVYWSGSLSAGINAHVSGIEAICEDGEITILIMQDGFKKVYARGPYNGKR